ncbi:hypothetical protein [Prosthecobacter sp.]|uniref:hypothetical protein n=1 Tax=Prosthecobacter sp. TaxID=1965333 RepID=UPI002AB90A6F|nr:hypothetical protein [Prosthecobacter sp.]MDZ4402143.1 hypothetical protein [Prosthecobacter sp.]
MTINQAFELITNLDYKEAHRRFAPQHGLLQFNSDGEVVGVSRYKTVPNETEQKEALFKHPGCIQIFTMPKWFVTADELQERINKDLWIFAHMKPRKEEK